MTDRRCFLSWFVLSLAIAGGGFFAYMKGVPQAIYAADESYMTSVILGWFICSSAYIGWQAWTLGGLALNFDGEWTTTSGLIHIKDVQYPGHKAPSASFGHLATEISVMLGLLGTTIGLSLQAKALIGGSAAFGPLATSLFCTMAGIAAALALRVMTFNLELGLRK